MEIDKTKEMWHKKNVSIFGKVIPAWLLVTLAMVGIGSAALLSYFGQIDGTVTVNQAIKVNDVSGQYAQTYSLDIAGMEQKVLEGDATGKSPAWDNDYIKVESLTAVPVTLSVATISTGGDMTGISLKNVKYFDAGQQTFSYSVHTDCTGDDITIMSDLVTRITGAVSGDVLCIADGTYSIDTPITISTSGISIVGKSEDPTKVVITTTDMDWTANIFSLQGNNIVISGMKLVINAKAGDPIVIGSLTTSADYNTVRNVVTNGGWEGVRIEGSSYNTIKDSTFEQAWHGIYIQGHDHGNTRGSDYTQILNNKIQNNYGELQSSGLSSSKGIVVLGSDGVEIRYNTITGGPHNTESDTTLNCIGVFSSINNVIEYNILEGCKIGMTYGNWNWVINRDSTFTSFNYNDVVGNYQKGVEGAQPTVLVANDNFWARNYANAGVCKWDGVGCSFDASWLPTVGFTDIGTSPVIEPHSVMKFGVLFEASKYIPDGTIQFQTTIQ